METKDKKKPEKKNEFYYYFNWPAGQENKIHYADCKICKHGKGKNKEKIPGKNGVWVGPFQFIDDVINTIQNKFHKTLPKVPFCSKCFKGKSMDKSMEVFHSIKK